MKTIIPILSLVVSSYVYSQESYLKVEQDYLYNKASFSSATEIAPHKEALDKVFSLSLKDNVIRRSEPFSIENMSDIEGMISTENFTTQPNLNLRFTTFEEDSPIDLKINRMKNSLGRKILRGQVDGHPESEVKLVIYDGGLSGRISYTNSDRVIVIHSLNNISAVYEIDVSDITYD